MTDTAAAIRQLHEDIDVQELERAERALEAELRAQDPAHVAAAELLSIRSSEVARVKRHRNGVVDVTTTDGVEYVVLPPDQPDAEGKTGVMFRHPPRTHTNFPVFAEKKKRRAERPTQATARASKSSRVDDEDPLDDDIARAQAVEAVEAEEELAQARARGSANVAFLEDRVRAAKLVLSRRRARLAAEDAELNPPPPSPEDVEYFTAVYFWALDIVGAQDEDDAMRRHRVHLGRDLKRFIAFRPGLAAVELDAVKRWFEGHGLALPS